jgi:hypothetical protein
MDIMVTIDIMVVMVVRVIRIYWFNAAGGLP